MEFNELVIVRGGGDLGSGVALRLWRSGFPIVILESEAPLAVRRTVCFSEAVFDRECRVEEATGRLVTRDDLPQNRQSSWIPVVVDPRASIAADLRPHALVDAIMAKRNLGTTRNMAKVVVALGPGFRAGFDVDAVIETNRGPHLGRVIWEGPAEADTGSPGKVAGHGTDRVLRAPTDGLLRAQRQIGELVSAGEIVADVSGMPVAAPFDGMLRGLARDGLPVRQGMKIGDLDPRRDASLVQVVSDKALAVAGGVLEAILSTLKRSEE